MSEMSPLGLRVRNTVDTAQRNIAQHCAVQWNKSQYERVRETQYHSCLSYVQITVQLFTVQIKKIIIQAQGARHFTAEK